MRISRITWLAIFLSCLLCLTEEAILRPYRRISSLLTNVNVSGEESNKRKDERLKTAGAGYPVYSPASGNFQPTPKRCCHIGERVAKKKMVCDIAMLAVVRKYNYEKLKYSNQYNNRPLNYIQRVRRRHKLSEKIAKCSAVHPKYFVKCCTYKEEFYKHMKKCQLRPKRQRRRCKQMIRKKYS